MSNVFEVLKGLTEYLNKIEIQLEHDYKRDPHDVNRVFAGIKADVVKNIRKHLTESMQDSNLTFYPVLNLGHGSIEVAEGISQDAYALILGNNGGGTVGKALQGNRFIAHDETLAILKFHSVQSLDVVLDRLNRLRERVIKNEPVQIIDTQGNVVQTITPTLSKGQG